MATPLIFIKMVTPLIFIKMATPLISIKMATPLIFHSINKQQQKAQQIVHAVCRSSAHISSSSGYVCIYVW